MKPVCRIVTAIAILICFLLGNSAVTTVYANELLAPEIADKEIDLSEKKDLPFVDLIGGKVPAIKDPIGGIIIPPYRPGIVPPEEEEPLEPLPEEYCMRDEYIVFAQHQDKQGFCWNFAATMAAATTIMKATNEYYDFSELWTGITCYTPKKQYSQIGAGGSFSYQYKAMQNCGLMLESDLPYQYSYTVSNENAADYYNYYSKYANDDVSGTLVYDSETSYSRKDVDEIKRHLLNHGSLYLAFSFKTGFLEEDGVYSLTPNQKNTNSNHAISVIGWDDNYEKEFYLDGSDTPTVYKGAWIVLNSYTETNGNDGISLIFYEDTNIYDVRGYRYEKDTTKSLYFYDKIEAGYEYPTSVKGKYYGDLTAQSAPTKQLNIFYDDVSLEYSYEISAGARINGIEIYLDGKDVTDDFDVRIDEESNRFYISKSNAEYGHYKVLVKYGNSQATDTYLNNFFVTHGLIGEELEFDHAKNALAFNTGKDLEYYSFMSSDKEYVIYTNTLKGTLSFLPIEQSVYSEKNMSIPTVSYEITDGKSCTVTHTITANSGYELKYNFIFIYCEDTTMQPIRVYYDLDGGVNSDENYGVELGNEASGLLLYAPTREGYTFKGWYIETPEGGVTVQKNGDTYLVNWDDIHHMGDAPPLYALSYYKQYYNNTNILFVRALWEKTEYTVTWQNWNGETISEGKYADGDSHVFAGAQPTRAADERYSYTFLGWIASSSGETVTYTAAFEAAPKRYTVTVKPTENGTVTTNLAGQLTCLDSSTYVFTPSDGYKVKDVKINGVSVGALERYTFTDVHSDQTVEVEFERTAQAAVIAIIVVSVVLFVGTAVLAIVIFKKR